MAKLIAALCLFFTFSSALNASAAENAIYSGFASCQAKIDGVPVRLDFFEAFRSENDKEIFLGKGFVVQTMGGENGLKMMSQIDIQDDAGTKKINIYAVLDPQTLFAKVEIPRNKKQFQLDIDSISFHSKWGVFDCEAKP